MHLIPPKESENVTYLKDLTQEQILQKLFDWRLITKRQQLDWVKKSFHYYPSKKELPIYCEIVGFLERKSIYCERFSNTIVLKINGNLHKVMAQYFKEMQSKKFIELDVMDD